MGSSDRSAVPNLQHVGVYNCSQLLLTFLPISLVPIIGIFGGAVVPLYKGMMSQTVDPDERGQFSLYYRVTALKCPVLSMSRACRGPCSGIHHLRLDVCSDEYNCRDSLQAHLKGNWLWCPCFVFLRHASGFGCEFFWDC